MTICSQLLMKVLADWQENIEISITEDSVSFGRRVHPDWKWFYYIPITRLFIMIEMYKINYDFIRQRCFV